MSILTLRGANAFVPVLRLNQRNPQDRADLVSAACLPLSWSIARSAKGERTTATGGLSLLVRRFEKSAGQIPMPVHDPTKHQFVSQQFVEQNMFVERPKHDEEALLPQPRLGKAAARPEVRMLPKQPTGGLYCRQVAICHLPAGVYRVLLELGSMSAMKSSVLRTFMPWMSGFVPARVPECCRSPS